MPVTNTVASSADTPTVQDFEAARRVLIVSDTHGVIHPDIARLADEVDLVVHAGDVGDHAVLQRLEQGGAAVVAVLGNNDVDAKWPAGQRRFLARLTAVAWTRLSGGLLVIEHGHRAGRVADRHALLRRRYPDARAVIYGHSHRICCDTSASPWVLNPGAAGRAQTWGGASCLTLRVTSAGRWRLHTHRFSSG